MLGAFCLDPVPGKLYAIQSSDGNYYRGRLLVVGANGKAIVHWIDYGNVETIALAQTRYLNEQFKSSISALAHRIFVPMELIGDKNQSDLEKAMFDFIGEVAITVNVIEMHGDDFICDILLNGASIIDAMVEQQIVKKISHDSLKRLIDSNDRHKIHDLVTELDEPPQPLSNGCSEQQSVEEIVLVEEISQLSVTESIATVLPNRDIGSISYSDNPNRFYMQIYSDIDALQQFQEMLQIVAPSLPALIDKRPGQMCIAKFSIDDSWYRGIIIDTSADITSIRFIDYGNTDTITNENFLKASNESLSSKKPYAIECSMPIQPLGTNSEWHEDACNKLNRLLETPMEFELLSKDGELHYVKLYAGGRDIMEELVFEEWAEACEIVKSDEKCYVSHVNGLDDFYIQLANDSNALQLIELHLSDMSKYNIIDNPKKDLICTALFIDGKFYRARVIDEVPTDCGYTVEFIDFGNTFTTNEIRSLDPNIGKIPHLRKRCSLKLPDEIEAWTPAAEDNFAQMAADGETEFTVQMIKPGKTACVELLAGVENVAHTLSQYCDRKQRPLEVIDEHENESDLSHQSIDLTILPEGKQNCGISHVNSPTDIYVQLEQNFDELEVMTANLAGAMDFEQCAVDGVPLDAIVAAFFPDDNSYYRARVLEKCDKSTARVQFIDFGNECVTTDLRKIVDMIRAKPPLALPCKLPDDLITNEQRDKFVDYMNARLDTTFQIEIVDSKNIPVTVLLYVDDVPIGDAMTAETINVNGNDNNNESNNNIIIATKAAVAEAIVDDMIVEIVSP